MFTCSVILTRINNYITILWLAAVCYNGILFIYKKLKYLLFYHILFGVSNIISSTRNN